MFQIITSLIVLATQAAGQASNPRGWEAAKEEEHGKSIPFPPSTFTPQQQFTTPSTCSAPTPEHPAEPPDDILFTVVAAFLAGVAVGYLWHRLASKRRPMPIEATDESLPAHNRRFVDQLQAEGSVVKAGGKEEDAGEGIDVLSRERIAITSSQIERSPEISIAATTVTTEGCTASLICPPGEVAGGLGTTLLNGPPTAVLLEKVGSILTSIDTSGMTVQEQLQYCSVALQADYSQQSQRLKSQEISLRSAQVNIAATAVTHTIAKDEAEEARRRAQEVQRMFSDCLAAGMALMAGAVSYQAWHGGIFVPLGVRCGTFPRVYSWHQAIRWGIYYRSFEVTMCYLNHIGDAVLGIAVLLLAAWLVHGSGLLQNSHGMPVAKLLIGLGIGCGTVGFIAVQKIGGDGWTWVALWAVWTVLHTVLSSTAHSIVRRDMRAARSRPESRPGQVFEESIWKGSTAWIAAVAWALVGLVLPVLMATLPFSVDRMYYYDNTQTNSGVILLAAAGALIFGRQGSRSATGLIM